MHGVGNRNRKTVKSYAENDLEKRYVLRRFLKTVSVRVDVTSGGRLSERFAVHLILWAWSTSSRDMVFTLTCTPMIRRYRAPVVRGLPISSSPPCQLAWMKCPTGCSQIAYSWTPRRQTFSAAVRAGENHVLPSTSASPHQTSST